MKFTEIIIDTPFWTNILIYMFLVKIRIKKRGNKVAFVTVSKNCFLFFKFLKTKTVPKTCLVVIFGKQFLEKCEI